jgi:hypothetical protein
VPTISETTAFSMVNGRAGTAGRGYKLSRYGGTQSLLAGLLAVSVIAANALILNSLFTFSACNG